MAKLGRVNTGKSVPTGPAPTKGAPIEQEEVLYEKQAVGKEIAATVQHYFDVKNEEKVVKAGIDSDSKFIKQYFEDNELEKFEVNDVTATVTSADKVSFNQAALLTHFKKLSKTTKIKGLIKRKEVLDMDVLEDAIYRKLLSKEQIAELSNFEETTTTKTLRIKGPK